MRLFIPMTTCVTAKMFSSGFVSYEATGSRLCADKPLCYSEYPGVDTSGTVSVPDMT